MGYKAITMDRAMQTGIDRSRRKPGRVFQAHRGQQSITSLTVCINGICS